MLSSGAADAATGDWRQLFQALCVAHAAWVDGLPIPPLRTIKSFILEDWARADQRFDRHMRRFFSFDFFVDPPPANVFDPE